jgi:EAL domain-containing protein (putative c-di-GMP-specific phosphodiesterase class I)
MGTDGRVVDWNPAAEQTFGYTRDEAVGRELAELIVPPEYRDAHRFGLARHLATGAKRVLGRRLELEAVRADADGALEAGGGASRLPMELASAGISVFDAGAPQNPGDALVAADIALYEAKEGGRDRVATFTGQQGQRLTWVGRIREAIEAHRLVLHSQPIVNLATGEAVGEELLVRMVDETGELVTTSAFLPTAERFGLIRDIDRWVVSRALELIAAGRRVSVNLSARSLSDPELTTRIEQGLRRAGADPALLVFEITETAAAADMEDVRAFAERVQRLGCGLALDDFGTGFGSFIYLKHLPVTELKIDMEFVRHVSHSRGDQRLVGSIVMMAQALGVRTVAEGVEDHVTLALLRNYGVDYAHG